MKLFNPTNNYESMVILSPNCTEAELKIIATVNRAVAIQDRNKNNNRTM